MHRINIDTIGPLPEDAQGNKYIIVMIDCFTRFCELYAVPSTSGIDCARCLLNFIGRYGAPNYLLSDRGSQFVNEIISALIDIVGSQHIFSLAYSKEENAVVERSNKEVMTHLRGIVFDIRLKKDWSLILPLVQRLLNSIVKESTGVRPSQLLFGNAIDLDRGIMFPEQVVGDSDNTETTPSVRQYLDKLLSSQALILKVAQETQKKLDEKHLQERGEKRSKSKEGQRFDLNSFVLLSYPAGLGGAHRPPSKLHTRWQGPFKVVGIQGDQYSLLDLVTTRVSNHHKKDLAPFHLDVDLNDPVAIAARDHDEYIIQSIVEHQGDLNKKKSDLQFRVRWAGLDESRDTWESWNE